jgi:predicted ATP-grasp superfamily ATP-dependent carboligase
MIRPDLYSAASRTPAFRHVPHILVTDGEQRSALAIVRSLGRAGHEVSVCSARARPLAGASRYGGASHRVVDPGVDPAAFRHDVEGIVERHRVDLIIPATDVSALPLLPLRVSGCRATLAFPDERSYLAVSDKASLLDVARGLGVAVPAQVRLEGPHEDGGRAHAFARERSFDVALKPARSAVLVGGAVSKLGVALVRTADEYRRALEALPEAAYPLLVQERISGPGLGVFLLTRAGEPIASFAHRRIREKPPTGGVSVYRESVALRDDVRRGAEAMLRHHAWTGVAMVEFKEDAKTGTPYLMEVNGRFWGSLQLAVDAGVDFPEMLVRVTLGEHVEPVSSYRVGLRSRWLWGDLDHLIWVLRRGRAHRGAHPEIPGPSAAIGRFLVPWRPGDRFEVLRASDPWPFVRESVEWLRAAVGGR